jgi:hypothetical protein
LLGELPLDFLAVLCLLVVVLQCCLIRRCFSVEDYLRSVLVLLVVVFGLWDVGDPTALLAIVFWYVDAALF